MYRPAFYNFIDFLNLHDLGTVALLYGAKPSVLCRRPLS